MIAEDITQIQHALQAADIAKTCKAPPYIIIAMLLHDIGQLLGEEHCSGISRDKLHAYHDDIGAQWMRDNGIPAFVSDISQYHTLAKVILCDRDSKYLSRLSLASQESYHIQKKKYGLQPQLSSETIEVILACRKIDDMAKINNYTPGSIDMYAVLFEQVVAETDHTHDLSWINRVNMMFDLYH